MQIKVYTIELAIPRWLKRTLLWAVIPAASLLGAAAAVRAGGVSSLTVFNAGETLSSAKINANFKALQDAVNTPVSAAQLAAGALPTGVTVAPGQISAGTLPANVPAAALNCSGCVGASQLAAKAITLSPVVQRVGSTTPVRNGTDPFYYYIGGDCDTTKEILVGGGCNSGANPNNFKLMSSTIDGGGAGTPTHWICAYYPDNGSTASPDAYAWSHCLKATWP